MPQPNCQPPGQRLLLGGCAACGLAALGLLLPDWLPLGIPGEWVWPRLAAPADVPEWIERSLPAFVIGTLLLGIAAAGDRVCSRLRPWQRWLLLPLLATGAAAWQAAAISATPSPHRELRWLWVNYDPWATGYFLDAVADTRSIPEFLAGCEAEAAAGDVLHRGTHPPGLPLLNRLLLLGTRTSPDMSRAIVGFADGSALQYFRSLEQQAALAPRLTEPELAALVLLSAAAFCCCACLPVCTLWLLEPLTGYRSAWRAAVLTAGLPAVSVFLPRSDCCYATTGGLLLLFTGRGLALKGRWQQAICGALAGTWAFACLQTSLAHLPVLAAAGLWTLLELLRTSGVTWRDTLRFWAGFTIALVAAMVAFGVLTSCRPWVVWPQNLMNHAAFYSEYPRTWWKWLLVNPLELAMAAGAPLALAAAAGLWQTLRRLFLRLPADPHAPLATALLIVWLLLLLSGKNQGEAARLWTFITPWAAIAALPLLAPGNSVTGGQTGSSRGWWLLFTAVQLIVCALTTGRCSGYLQL